MMGTPATPGGKAPSEIRSGGLDHCSLGKGGKPLDCRPLRVKPGLYNPGNRSRLEREHLCVFDDQGAEGRIWAPRLVPDHEDVAQGVVDEVEADVREPGVGVG